MNFVFPILQGVHVGNMTEEAEKNKETVQTGTYQESHAAHQLKSRYPVKQTGGARAKSEQNGKIPTRVKPSGWTCSECRQQFTERDTYVSHVKTKHGKVRMPSCPRWHALR